MIMITIRFLQTAPQGAVFIFGRTIKKCNFLLSLIIT